MKLIVKKYLVFILVFISLFILFSALMNFVLPVKTSMVSGNIGRYNNGDILFYTESNSYTIDDYILYRPSSIQSILVAEIVDINSDGTFKVIGTDLEPIDDLDQSNLKQEQIIGKVVSSLSMYIFYPIVIVITLILSYIVTHFAYKKIKKDNFLTFFISQGLYL
jgi:hypothetical protein